MCRSYPCHRTGSPGPAYSASPSIPPAPAHRTGVRLGRLFPILALAACGGDGGDGAPATEGEARSPIFYPSRLDETAPERFRARFETSAGDFTVEVHREWAPRGADRFYNLVKHGFFDDMRVYRVVEDFMAQFGLHGDPVVTYQWRNEFLPDDPVAVSNTRGRMSFAVSGPNSRVTDVFINLEDNPGLDDQGFSPFGEVVEGMETVDAFHAGYGDGPPRGEGPYQAQARAQGNAYLDQEFRDLTVIRRATLVEGG